MHQILTPSKELEVIGVIDKNIDENMITVPLTGIRRKKPVLWVQRWIWIRIQGAKQMRIHAEAHPGQTLPSQNVEFLHEKCTFCS